MSDIDPELPDYLIEAILSQTPPPADVDLVKQAFTWRTIDAELMELAYDNVLEEAGVRDADAQRVLEFVLEDLSVLLEIERRTVTGRISPPQAAQLEIRTGDQVETIDVGRGGDFVVEAATAGPVSLTLVFDGRTVEIPAFVVG